MNKKILSIFIVFLLVNTALFGQLKKGMRMTGASIASAIYNSGETEVSYPAPTAGYISKTTSFSISLNPSFGSFVSDNLAIGGTLVLNPSGSKTRFEYQGTTYQRVDENNFNFGAGGFVRNYFGKTNFMPFGQASVNLGVSSRKTDGVFYGISAGVPYKITSEGKSNDGFYYNATLALGVTKMVTPNTGLELFLGYTYSANNTGFKTTSLTDSGNDGSVESTSIIDETKKFTNHGFQIGLGFQIFLNAKN